MPHIKQQFLLATTYHMALSPFLGKNVWPLQVYIFISMSVANFSPILALSQSAGKWDFLAGVEAEVA